MKLSSSAWILATLLVTAASTGASCAFPEIVFFNPPSADTTTGSGGGSTTAPTATGGGSGATETSAANGGSGDSGGASSSSSADSSSTGGLPCTTDKDKDGFISWECAGGTDCADEDAKAHPDPPSVSLSNVPIQGARSPSTQPFDFNCDGQQTGETSVPDCALLCLGGGGNGYEFPVKCGESGFIGHCELVTCAWKPDSPLKDRVQKCK